MSTCALDPIASHLPKDLTSLVMPSPSQIIHRSLLVLKATCLFPLFALVPSATNTAGWNSHSWLWLRSTKERNWQEAGEWKESRRSPVCASDNISYKSCMSPITPAPSEQDHSGSNSGQVTPAIELLCPFHGKMAAVFFC